MAVNGTHDVGEEFKQKTIYRQDLIDSREASLTVGLYNDNTDSFSETSDTGDLTSEPTTGNYSRQTLSLDSGDLSLSQDGSSDLQTEGTVTFDVSDTGETVDGFFVIVSFQSDVVNSEGSANDHIILSGTFGTTDLTNFISIDVTVQDVLS